MSLKDIDGYVRKYGPVIIFLLLLSIIVLDLRYPDSVILTWQIVALICIAVVVPFLPLIKKIRYGDWEAELEGLIVEAERDIKETQRSQNIDETPTEPTDETPTEPTDETPTEPTETGSEDSISKFRQMANAESRVHSFRSDLESYLPDEKKIPLAMLRRELDVTLKALAEQEGIQYHEELGISLNELSKINTISSEELDQIQSIYEITNKAVHGKEVSLNNARRIIDLGEDVLGKLYLKLDGKIDTDYENPAIELDRS